MEGPDLVHLIKKAVAQADRRDDISCESSGDRASVWLVVGWLTMDIQILYGDIPAWRQDLLHRVGEAVELDTSSPSLQTHRHGQLHQLLHA